MPDIQPEVSLEPYDNHQQTSRFKISVGLINPGDADLILPPSFFNFPINALSYFFVDVSENPVTPGVGGLIRFAAKTKVNPHFYQAIRMTENGVAVSDLKTELDPITLAFAPAATKILVTASNLTIATDVIVTIQGFAQS